MSGRNPPSYCRLTSIAIQGHQSKQRQRGTMSLDTAHFFSIIGSKIGWMSAVKAKERRYVHDDRGNPLSLGNGDSRPTIIVMVFTADFYFWDR